ncbi:hypothetical protein GCM10027035_44430 [Emticicia sediminis]
MLFCLTSKIVFSQSYHFNILKDINYRTQDSDIKYIGKRNNEVLILERFADTLANDYKIKFWKTDGNILQNYAIGDISQYAYFRDFFLYNNKYYFIANNSTENGGIWVTDLTASNTKLITRFHSSYDEIIGFNNKIFYPQSIYPNGVSTQLGNELMYYDETQNACFVLKDINPSYEDSDPKNLTVVGDKLYFTANEAPYFEDERRSLWVTDGTTAGTSKVKDLTTPYQYEETIKSFSKMGNKLIFEWFDGDYISLFVSDGTNEGTKPFKRINSFSSNAVYVNNIFELGNKALIKLSNNSLWITDGTNENTKLINSCDALGVSSKKELAIKDGYVFYFSAGKLYKTDGNTSVLLKQGLNYSSTNTIAMTSNQDGGYYYFSLLNVFFKTDGTEVGTTRINNKLSYNDNPSPIPFSVVGNKVLTFGKPADSRFSKELFEVGIDTLKLFRDFTPSTLSSEGSFILNYQGKSYFWAKQPKSPNEMNNSLFETDGTLEGTRGILMPDFNYPYQLIATNKGVYITFSNQIWQANFNNGTLSLVKTLTNFFQQKSGLAFNSKFYFITTTFASYYLGNDFQLWESDGTTAGTVVIKEFPATQSLRLSKTGDNLYIFSKTVNSINIWQKSQNNSEINLLKTVNISTNDYLNEVYPNFQNKVLFMMRISNQNQLWESDGTINGTKINQSTFPEINEYSDLFVSDNYYYYSIYTPNVGTKIWKLNGEDTSLLIDIPDAISKVYNYALCGNNLFFVLKRTSGKDYLYKYDLSNGNIEVLSIMENFNKEYTKNFICLKENLAFSAKSNSSDSGKSQLHISDGTQVGTRFIASMENKVLGFNSHASRGIFPLNDKEILVSVDDKFYDLEWFTFRICDNPSDLSGLTSDSKIQSSPSTINSTERLTGDSRVYYFAPQSINLNPGFSTDNSGIFKAEIKERGCTFRN